MEGIKHIFVINPAAGKTDSTNSVAASIHALAKKRALDCEILITEYPRHAVELVRQKIGENGGRRLRFYACGGDGTLNEVAAGAAGAANVSITHYPTGSGNDFIKLFGADMKRFERLEDLLDGTELAMDYIESDCGIAANVLSVGVDARVAAGMQKYKRFPLLQGAAAYNISTVESLLSGIHQPYAVEIDGQPFSGEYTLILAANGRFYGGGFNPVPEADPQDGLLDVLLVKAVNLLTAAKVIGAYKKGLFRNYPELIRHIYAKEMTIHHPDGKEMVINLDGEIARANRISFRVSADKLHFAVPRGVTLLPPRKPE